LWGDIIKKDNEEAEVFEVIKIYKLDKNLVDLILRIWSLLSTNIENISRHLMYLRWTA
jgi:hypothetical protein